MDDPVARPAPRPGAHPLEKTADQQGTLLGGQRLRRMEIEPPHRAGRDVQAPPAFKRVEPLREDLLVDHPVDVAHRHGGDDGGFRRGQELGLRRHPRLR
jgi:hypothetical protein